MSFTVDLLPDEPILLEIMNEDYQYLLEGEADADQATAVLDQLEYPVFYIVDMTKAHFSMDDVLTGASLLNRRAALFKHPNVREYVLVSQSRVIDLAARGLNAPIFGRLKLKVFQTQEEALAYAREKILSGG